MTCKFSAQIDPAPVSHIVVPRREEVARPTIRPYSASVFERNRQPERGDFVFGGGSPAVREAACEYRPRRPEESVLYGAVAGHLKTFLARQRERGRLVPRFVERELRAFLDCGILARGFLRVHCDVCRLDRVVPYSCKCRGYAELMNMRSTVTSAGQVAAFFTGLP